MKVDINMTKNEYNTENIARKYEKDVENLGLWESERVMIEKYCKKEERLLDIGCGAGRSTFGLYEDGYKDIVAVDLAETMIELAKKRASYLNVSITFIQADAMNLPFKDWEIDHAFFSYNGLMTIPGKDNRIKAMREVARVLKPGGYFIFTTHDFTRQGKFRKFWEEEEKRWKEGKQDPRLHDFGDKIILDNGRESFLHFAKKEEVHESIKAAGFTYVEDIYRPEITKEKPAVIAVSNDNIFWIVRK